MRLLTPAIKYWVCKSAPGFLYEAMECLGGNGYVEEGILARHYREAPVNAIWEGSGNVMCLDVLRALSREAGSGGCGVAGTDRRDARACRARARRSRSSARRSAGRTASASRGWRSRRLALLAAAAALNAGVAAPCRIVRRDPPCRESRQHVRRGGSGPRRHQRPAGAGAAVNMYASVMAGPVPAIHVFAPRQRRGCPAQARA